MVYKAIKKMGNNFFENAWSPMLGDVTVGIDEKDEHSTNVYIRSKVNDNLCQLNGDGKIDDNGELMVFVSKGSPEMEWKKYVHDNGLKPLEYYMEMWYAEKQMSAYDYIVDDVIHFIDFEKIAKVMKFLDWKWYMGIDYDSKEWEIIKSTCNNPELAAWTSGRFDRVPNSHEVKNQCLKLINQVLEHKDKTEWKSSTGGFEVGFRCYPPEPGEEDDLEHSVDFYVRFVLEEYNSLI